MRCRLLLPMIVVSVRQSVTRLKSASLCKNGCTDPDAVSVNTLGGPRNIALDGGSDPPLQKGGGFDAAFAKLLWPLVWNLFYLFLLLKLTSTANQRRLMNLQTYGNTFSKNESQNKNQLHFLFSTKHACVAPSVTGYNTGRLLLTVHDSGVVTQPAIANRGCVLDNA